MSARPYPERKEKERQCKTLETHSFRPRRFGPASLEVGTQPKPSLSATDALPSGLAVCSPSLSERHIGLSLKKASCPTASSEAKPNITDSVPCRSRGKARPSTMPATQLSFPLPDYATDLHSPPLRTYEEVRVSAEAARRRASMNPNLYSPVGSVHGVQQVLVPGRLDSSWYSSRSQDFPTSVSALSPSEEGSDRMLSPAISFSPNPADGRIHRRRLEAHMPFGTATSPMQAISGPVTDAYGNVAPGQPIALLSPPPVTVSYCAGPAAGQPSQFPTTVILKQFPSPSSGMGPSPAATYTTNIPLSTVTFPALVPCPHVVTTNAHMQSPTYGRNPPNRFSTDHAEDMNTVHVQQRHPHGSGSSPNDPYSQQGNGHSPTSDIQYSQRECHSPASDLASYGSRSDCETGEESSSPGASAGMDHAQSEDAAPLCCKWISPGLGMCNEYFQSMPELVDHITHHVNSIPDRNFVCSWADCVRQGVCFKAKYKLVNHVRVHTNEKPFKCRAENCGRLFARSENLRIHMRVHSGEKPFKCPHFGCTKSFANSSDRKKHTFVHSQERPYACREPGCTKRYTHPSSLRKHALLHKSPSFHAHFTSGAM